MYEMIGADPAPYILMQLIIAMVVLFAFIWFIKIFFWSAIIRDRKYTAFELAVLRQLEEKIGIDTDKEYAMLKTTDTNKFRNKMEKLILQKIDEKIKNKGGG